MKGHRLYRPRSVSLSARLRTAKKALLLCLFTALTLCMLLENEKALELSLTGLNLWFEKMIPTLLPFMILSGILIRMNLSDSFARLFSPLLRPVFRLSDSCLYVIVIGFLCGFPMGARVTAESLQRGRLSHREASLLLSFCNNIGPIYFSGFVLTLFPVAKPWLFWAGMYLLPLLYGLFLRYTLYRDIPLYAAPVRPLTAASSLRAAFSLRAASESYARAARSQKPSLLEQMQDSISSSLVSIASLGGYMILFNLMNLLPDLLLPARASLPRALCGCILEITSGLSRLAPSDALWGFILLPLGGLSCIAQTYSMIRETDLSLKQYVLHKCIQTLLAFGYYSLIFRFAV
ncbi:MAG TPA: hypothetical protein H9717_14905 [Candidatus Eisenbergiella merdipullorum]|uniref:Nucleoside transporter/FeoB GTPase Gate domain-containing protein n=1 Tax=Candidatus Eisenbergiella merdipullorum TaxID=2838553 RepID=A0A9D2I7W3_9FIRM|nr:hypothetical protein [Candidatus Eisenbergiella merdipullorum]